MPNSWPIRRHLFALVLAIILPMAGLLVYSLQSSLRSSLAEASATTLTLAQIAAADAQRFVHDSGALLAGLARRPKVRALDPADCDPILTDFNAFLPQFANLAIADQAGRVVCSARPQPNGKLASVAGAAWLKQVGDANYYIAGQPHIGPVSGKWVSVLAQPIQDDQGRFTGAIGLPIDLANYLPVPSSVSLPEGTAIRIVAADGILVATSAAAEKALIGLPFAGDSVLARAKSERYGHVWEGTGSGGTVYGYAVVNGTDWHVISSVPATVIFKNPLLNAAKSGAILLLLTLLGGVMAYYLGRRIVLPVMLIAGAAKAVAKGDLGRRAEIKGPRELKDVAEQFNQMLDVRLRAEDKYRNLLESCTDAIVVVNVSNAIILVNAQAEKMFGFSRTEMIGQPIEMLIPASHRDQHVAHTSEYMAAPRRRPMYVRKNLQAQRKDGVEFPVEITLSPMQTDDGLIVSSIIRDLSERQRYEDRLAHLAQFDALTGLPNRTLLRDRLEQAMGRIDRDGGKVGLILLDIDRFNEINDTLGHKSGDRVLQAIGERLSASLREVDTVARPGGDEFIVVAEVAQSESQIQLVAEHIQQAFALPLEIDGREIFISVSIGLTVYPDDGSDSETLFKNADVAMYQSKQDGRNTFRFYAPAMDARASERLDLENRLRRALPNNELLLHYQPQVDTRGGYIRGVEALVRWNNPELGLVPPARFIGVAEETGLIDAFGEWILRTACAQNKAWQDMGLPPMVMAVNISARQFLQKNLAQQVQRILLETGLDPAWLELEITESMLMQRPEQAEETLHAIAATGVGISLDDFGTGYSSLSYLKRFPVGILKIDQSFVRNLHTDQDDAAIVTAVISLAKSMKMGLVAEGVELAEQLDFLTGLDCESYQGYFFSKPLPAAALTELLQNHK
jgi:diguanylate cyclase (GGDEF)-like protein/PAS domain S-box-containing protein